MRTQPDALSSLALRAPAPGLHALAAGQARRWCASRSGELRVARGSLWITFDGPQPGTEAGPQGDLFLHAGERLAVPAGASVVIEPASRYPSANDAAFTWQAQRPVGLGEAVRGPASDLSHALGDAAHALSRLMAGVWSAGRGPWRA